LPAKVLIFLESNAIIPQKIESRGGNDPLSRREKKISRRENFTRGREKLREKFPLSRINTGDTAILTFDI
jgi:hypothetical protein